jgi:glycosyltransferase involved in cell wall biosynthesis
MAPHVAAFTDTYHPTVNGVTYTLTTWRDRWATRGGRMDVVFPRADGYTAADGEYPVRSLPFPFYEGFRVGSPTVPNALADADLVHAHTPFAVGIAGRRLARRHDLPLVASYHTPASEYASYVAPTDRAEAAVARVADRYERWFYDRADLVLTPSSDTRRAVRDRGVETPIEVVPNGVDLDRFRPVDTDAFRARHDLPTDRPLVGYTGRHGYEKRLDVLVDAADGLDATLVFGGDGPARADLEAQAARNDVDARFLGFLDREELPELYATLDVFAFPSPVETQGLVALEAMACGTPVVGVAAGALADTIDDGATGRLAPPDDPDAFRDAVRTALDDRTTLRETCLARRDSFGVDTAVDRLEDCYDRVL